MPQRKQPLKLERVEPITPMPVVDGPHDTLYPPVPTRAMALLTILRYPDPRLHKVAGPVAGVDARIRQLVDDMLETMYAADGVGLAATQVDVHERVIVIDTSEQRDLPLVLINPELVWRSDDRAVNEEGCL